MSYYAISDNKLKHSIAVGRYMQKYATERLLNPELGKEWFLIGYLHDIGEEFTNKKEEHNKVGCTLLKEQKYKYWKEVYYHGDPKTPYISPALLVLNLAELCVGSDGKVVGIDTKLNKIKEKFGEDSIQYKNTKALANLVRNTPVVLK